MARQLAAPRSIPCLSMDAIAWDPGPSRRPLERTLEALAAFVDAHDEWIVEGCYADLAEALLPRCTELRFLNPGVEACVANCRRRPWEPDKFDTPEAQERMVEALVEWVRTYEAREDEYGLRRHRDVFDAFDGPKREYGALEPLGNP